MNIINYIDGLKHASTALTSLNTMSYEVYQFGEKAGKLTSDSIARLSLATSRLNEEQARLVLSTKGLTVEQQNQVLAENGLIATSDKISASIAHQNLQKTALSQTEREQLLIDLQLMDADTKRLLTENACTEAELRAILAKRGYIGASQDEIVAAILGNNIRSQEIITWELLSASIKKAAVELWTFLTTNPVGWAILATGAIAGTVAIVNALTVSVEESREKLQDLKDECETIESDLSSMNDELKTTIDRMNELAQKDKLTFAEKEEYNNLVETNNELQRSIDLLKLEQKLKNAEKNKTFVQTMQKDVTVQDERVHTGRMRKDDTAETILITETELIQRKFEQLYEWQEKLKNATTETEISAFQEQIDRITDYLLEKNEEWKTDSEGISYILDPSTEDEKAVNQWLDYINDFQDKMAIAMGGDNAKTNAFGRLVDNWAFDEVVQELQDLGKQGQVTADMLDDPKYDEFINKLVELGIIDTTDNIDDIVLAFNTLGKSLDDNTDTINNDTTPSIDSLTNAFDALGDSLDDIFDKQEKLTDLFAKIASGARLTTSEIYDLIKEFPALIDYLQKTDDGYTFSMKGISKVRNDEITSAISAAEQSNKDYQAYLDHYNQLIEDRNNLTKTELEKHNEKMQNEFGVGNVDLTNRPKVVNNDGSISTVNSSYDFIWQGDEKNGKYVAVHYTPILPNGEVLDNNTLNDYLASIGESGDILGADKDGYGIILKVDDIQIPEEDIDNLHKNGVISSALSDYMEQANAWDIALHDAQATWLELENDIKHSNSADYYEQQGKSKLVEGLNNEIDALAGGVEKANNEIEKNNVLIDLLDYSEHEAILEGIDIQYDNAKSSVDDYNNSIKSIDSAIDKMNKKQALTYDEMVELVEINPEIASSIDERADGYYVEINALEDLRFESKKARDEYIQHRIDEAQIAIDAANAIVSATNLINSATAWKEWKEQKEVLKEWQEILEKYKAMQDDLYTDDTTTTKDDPITTAFEKELKYLDYLRDMGMISAKEYYKQLYFLNEKYYSDNDKYLEQYRDNEVKIRDGITDVEIRAIDRQIEALELLKEKREEEKELQELQVELEEKKLELLNKQNQKNVRYYDADKREWIWTYNREDVADAQKAVDEAQEALDEHLYQSNEDKKIEQLEQIKEILQGDEDNPNNSTQWSGSEGVTTQATARKVTAEEFYARLGLSQKVDTTALMRSIYAMGLQPNVQKIAESTHNQNISTVNRNIQGNQFTVNIDGSGLNESELTKAIENGTMDALMKVARQMELMSR